MRTLVFFCFSCSLRGPSQPNQTEGNSHVAVKAPCSCRSERKCRLHNDRWHHKNLAAGSDTRMKGQDVTMRPKVSDAPFGVHLSSCPFSQSTIVRSSAHVLSFFGMNQDPALPEALLNAKCIIPFAVQTKICNPATNPLLALFCSNAGD